MRQTKQNINSMQYIPDLILKYLFSNIKSHFSHSSETAYILLPRCVFSVLMQYMAASCTTPSALRAPDGSLVVQSIALPVLCPL
jgi:hypothetical protein